MAPKLKPMLTGIPEEERSINYRFTIVLVGETAGEFATLAATSDTAEAYRPKCSKQRRSTVVKQLEGITEAEGDEEAPSSPLAHLESPPPSPSKGRRQDDQLTIFCPTGPNTKELARLRLHPCVGFSDALPLTPDAATAKFTIVALLFWQLHKGEPIATEDTIREWYSRMAEVNHLPASLRPLTVVLAYEADDSQEKSLRAFAEKQKVDEPKLMRCSAADSLTESLQDLAEAAIFRLRWTSEKASSVGEGEISVRGRGRGRCCALL